MHYIALKNEVFIYRVYVRLLAVGSNFGNGLDTVKPDKPSGSNISDKEQLYINTLAKIRAERSATSSAAIAQQKGKGETSTGAIKKI